MNVKAVSGRIQSGFGRIAEVYEAIGLMLGVPLAVAVFLGIYGAAVGSVGWVIGLALGWIPAWLGAVVALQLARYTWPAAVIGAFWAYSILVQ